VRPDAPRVLEEQLHARRLPAGGVELHAAADRDLVAIVLVAIVAPLRARRRRNGDERQQQEGWFAHDWILEDELGADAHIERAIDLGVARVEARPEEEAELAAEPDARRDEVLHAAAAVD